MHLKRFSTFILITILASLSLYANEAILSKDRLEIFDLSKEKAQEDASKLKKIGLILLHTSFQRLKKKIIIL